MNVIVTGGAGFIGSALVRFLIHHTEANVINVDCLTYAANLDAVASVASSPRYRFVQLDICNTVELAALLADSKPELVFHLAAESHVDRSIAGPMAFMHSNVVGTCSLLEAARAYWTALSSEAQMKFRLLYVSTDEVYGDLGMGCDRFNEQSAYAPSSPYSASKASGDHLVRAWHRTYGLPSLITHCTNNYGPYQHAEKLIPHMIMSAVRGQPLPLYGQGTQIRDWLYVDDHVEGLYRVAMKGRVGETYDMGGCNEVRNIEVVEMLCALLEEMHPDKPAGVHYYRDLITYVADRPGHDVRYSIDCKKIMTELEWRPRESFASGLARTVQWYLQDGAFLNS